tara:strand:+ start:340 stop:873 length:534 start_codon:yes stop_codon:yes gene_type:complete
MASRIPTMYGRYYVLTVVWRGREYDITVFRSKLQKLQRPQAQKIAQSVYPGSRVIKYHESDPTDGTVFMTNESLASSTGGGGGLAAKTDGGSAGIAAKTKKSSNWKKKGQSKKPLKPNISDGHWSADSTKQALPPAVGGIFGEDAPPGREKQVKALKKKVGKDKAYAFAWAQHNKKK